MLRPVLSLLPLLVLACATTAPVTAPAPEMAPTPFTADQIRDATPKGRTYEFRREMAGKPTSVRTMTFVRVDATSADLTTTARDEAGAELEPEKTSTVAWEELRKHAAFPKAAVKITEESVTVPVGTFDCMLYTVTDGDEIARFYFAKAMPGAPVLFSIEQGGQRVMTSTLVRYVAGG